MKNFVFFITILLGIFLAGVKQVEGACPAGQTCKATRTVNSYVCSGGTTTGTCKEWSDALGSGCDSVCEGQPGVFCDNDSDCGSAYREGDCIRVCCEYGEEVSTGGSCVSGGNTTVACDVSASACFALGNRTVCTMNSTYGTCDQTTRNNSDLGCCISGGSHKTCADGSCVSVVGDGVDECSTNDQCGGGGGDSHFECVGLTCSSVGGAEASTCSVNADCVPSYNISGGVYWDDTKSRDKSSPVANAGTVGITGQTLGVVGGDGLYSITGVPDGESYAALLSGLDSLYTCDDPNDCELSITLSGANVTNADFFVTTERDAWWQTVGGDVGSNASNVVSNIPNSCIEPICYPYMSRGAVDNSGVITYWSGSNDFGDGGSAGEGVDYVANAKIPTNRGIEGYDFFYRQFEMGIAPEDDFVSNKTLESRPGVSELNGRAYFSDGDLTLTNGAWTLAPTESVVIFVNGNLNINTQINTPLTGFIAFIVSGDITFSGGTAVVGSETPLVQGVFIADGNLIFPAGVEKFIGEGIFIGWGGVVMSRDFGGIENNTNPTELFMYRPDFVSNAPDAMRRPVMRWNEVAP